MYHPRETFLTSFLATTGCSPGRAKDACALSKHCEPCKQSSSSQARNSREEQALCGNRSRYKESLFNAEVPYFIRRFSVGMQNTLILRHGGAKYARIFYSGMSKCRVWLVPLPRPIQNWLRLRIYLRCGIRIFGVCAVFTFGTRPSGYHFLPEICD